MTRVIHTGDTHIGYQQYHSPERRADFLEAFQQVVTDAVEDDVDAVVHAGDLFHDRRPELQDLLGTLSILRDLDDTGIPFLAIVGNHESTRGGQWLDLFESLGLATRLDDTPTVVGDTAFYGLDHVPVSQRDDLAYEFADHDADHAALVAHGLFEPFAHADWDTEAVLTESTVDFDAMLLGDNHKPDRAEVADTWVTYPGSTERASASEEQGRGYNLVTFDAAAPGDDPVEIRRRSLETRPFEFISVDLREGEGVDRVTEQVRQHDLEDAVAIVEITGEGEPIAPATVEDVATERGALIARVTDRREIETEEDLDVSFADPEDAVRERIDEMGLSPAAFDVDETVRATKVADSNVRDAVKNALEERLDAGDLGAFEGAVDLDVEESGEGPASAADETVVDDEAVAGDAADTVPEPADATAELDAGEPDKAESTADEAESTADEAAEAEAAESETAEEEATADDATADESTEDETTEDETTEDETTEPDPNPPAEEGQVSMEDYL